MYKNSNIKKVVVFSGSTEGDGSYVSLAEDLGRSLALAGYTVVNGGGPGLMEVVAKSAYENGGKVIGIHFNHEGRIKSKYNSETISYSEIIPRQQKVMSLGDAFVVLPGGLGTLYELVEVLAKKHLGDINKEIPVLLSPEEFWRPFNDIIKQQINKQFMSKEMSKKFKVVDSAKDVLAELGGSEEVKQISEQEARWDSRAGDWDKDINSPEHYANFEDGYQKFLNYEQKILNKISSVEIAIDLGCGSGQTTKLLSAKAKKIYILDISEKMLEEANKKVPSAIPLHASVTEIPLPAKYIDLAISRGIVLSHLPAKLAKSFFEEIARIMKSGGTVLFDYLSNPDTADYKNSSPKIPFTMKEIEEKLEAQGFTEINFDGKDEDRVVRVSAKKI